jgi:hypothetical protein
LALQICDASSNFLIAGIDGISCPATPARRDGRGRKPLKLLPITPAEPLTSGKDLLEKAYNSFKCPDVPPHNLGLQRHVRRIDHGTDALEFSQNFLLFSRKIPGEF